MGMNYLLKNYSLLILVSLNLEEEFFMGINKDFISSCKINLNEIDLFQKLNLKRKDTLTS